MDVQNIDIGGEQRGAAVPKEENIKFNMPVAFEVFLVLYLSNMKKERMDL